MSFEILSTGTCPCLNEPNQKVLRIPCENDGYFEAFGGGGGVSFEHTMVPLWE